MVHYIPNLSSVCSLKLLCTGVLGQPSDLWVLKTIFPVLYHMLRVTKDQVVDVKADLLCLAT